MGFANRAIVAAGLGFTVFAIAGCGGSGSLLSSSQADRLSGQLASISNALNNGSCHTASAEITSFERSVAALQSVNSTLVRSLAQGARTVSQLAVRDCQVFVAPPVRHPSHTSTTRTRTNTVTTTTQTSTGIDTTTTPGTTLTINTTTTSTNGGIGLGNGTSTGDTTTGTSTTGTTTGAFGGTGTTTTGTVTTPTETSTGTSTTPVSGGSGFGASTGTTPATGVPGSTQGGF